MAKARKLMGLFTVLLASMLLVACGQKTTKDGVQTILQDKYSGYSKVYGTDGPFSEGGSELAFDKKKNTIVNLSSDDGKNVYYYQVVPEDKLTSEEKGILSKHRSELENNEYFLMKVDNNKSSLPKIVNEKLGVIYGVILSDGGKSIRIFEFESGAADAYYDFTGQATK